MTRLQEGGDTGCNFMMCLILWLSHWRGCRDVNAGPSSYVQLDYVGKYWTGLILAQAQH